MKRTAENKIGKWRIIFKNNVHMYCHELVVAKGEQKYQIPCEDLPSKGNFVGIWLCDMTAPESHKDELCTILLRWAEEKNMRIKIYTDRDTWFTNVKDANKLLEVT